MLSVAGGHLVRQPCSLQVLIVLLAVGQLASVSMALLEPCVQSGCSNGFVRTSVWRLRQVPSLHRHCCRLCSVTPVKTGSFTAVAWLTESVKDSRAHEGFFGSEARHGPGVDVTLSVVLLCSD